MDLVEVFKEEVTAIKRAPITFVTGFVVLGALIFGAEYSLIFKEWLARKDSVIQDKENVISDKIRRVGDLEAQVKAMQEASRNSPISVPAKPRHSATGAATTFGDNSPGSTGNGNTFNYGNVAGPKPEKK